MISRRKIRPNLTPLIDVVFILLLFFLLSTQMGRVETVAIETAMGGGDAVANAPYLIELGENLRVDGRVVNREALDEILRDKTRAVAVRPEAGVSTEALLLFVGTLQAAGFERIVLVEGS